MITKQNLRDENFKITKNWGNQGKKLKDRIHIKFWIVTLLLSVFMWQCSKDDFTGETKSICPEVVSTDPAGGASDVLLNKQISATFNKPMDGSTINTNTFMLKQGSTVVPGTVTYSGLIATFIPAVVLSSNTTYTAIVTKGAKDPAKNALVEDYIWTFTTGSAPLVVSTDPANGASGVPLSKVISALFSKPMNLATINSETFTLKQGLTTIPGVVTYSGNTAVFTPSANLSPNTVYTGTITTGAKDVLGNSLLSNYVWSFNTGNVPSVIQTDPANGEINVPLAKVVSITFNKQMDPATINTSTVLIKQGTNAIAGLVTYSGNVATFTPTGGFTANTLYTGTITIGAKDALGNPMLTNYIWTFTTGTLPFVVSTDPLNEAVNVELDKRISATFNTAMDPLSLNTTTVTIKQGTTSIPGIVTYFGNVVTFTPSVALSPGTLYTGTITTGAKDLAGNHLAANYTWSFTTGAVPVVISTDPVNNAVNVPISKIITATFSKAMDPATINGTTVTIKQGSIPVAGTITYFGNVATFTPAANLLPGTLYTGTITSGVQDLTGNNLANNYTWVFTTGALPVVVSTDPLNLATNVALDKVISATFSKAMDPSTFNNASFVVQKGAVSIAGVVTYFGMKGSFVPSANLDPNTVYTCTITNTVKDATGNAMASNYTWSFTTGSAPDVTRPTVILTSPLSNAVNVSLNTNVTATFSELMDISSINTLTFTLKNGLVLVPGVVTYSGLMATFNPNVDLLSGTTYRATVTTGAKDIAGNTLISNYEWEFTTNIPAGPGGIDLRTAESYAVLAGSGISSTGPTIVNGDMGTSPTGTINGFPPGIVNGVTNAANAAAAQAKLDLTTAFLDGQSRSTSAISLPGDLSGLTLTPGLYVNSTSVLLSSGTVWLDAQGDANATFIFKMGSTLTSLAGTQVVLSGGALAKNIYWIVGTSATLGTNSIFYGNILADQSITLETGAVLNGRALTQIAAVSLDASIVNRP
ncbi:MAG: hypothetical protein A2X19_03830 [Bacteroidetes bacterium GWE2_39_28]|nr:MAG: hypothetical protein A2X19_03830 [Bacteroidetes bacterium GWE2_39_28]OFY14861.1 MAG: hypothetical protein A2X16_09745 [Bacteroidetes bacterium GWF2_39_10]OFZ10721.1 MAG: hypothetical protein A2465_05145 [Bacteroidetes bacterium RIFOXYC2_FULL_39_11]HCT93220.1 hypothetical protein [Rikenellaceae bacterium]